MALSRPALSRPALPSARALLHRPAVLLPTTALALAALLGSGLLVANAVDGPAAVPVSASSSPSPGPEAAGAPSGDAAGAVSGDASDPTGAEPLTTSGGDDNVAAAVNTRDGSTVYAVRLKVVLTGADVVDAQNAAVAVASCADCQTVAIALEGVIVTGDADVVAPENIALAINTGCSGCQTLAYAYQHLQTVDGKVRLTGEGRRTVAQLRSQLQALRRSGLDVLAVKREVDRIAEEFAAVLTDEVVPLAPATGPAATGAPAEVAGAPDGAASPGPAAATSAPPTPSPAPTAEPAVEPSAEPSAKPSATAEVTAVPTPTGG